MAASVAALTVYDMCKALDKGIVIREVDCCANRAARAGITSARREEDQAIASIELPPSLPSVTPAARGERADLSGPRPLMCFGSKASRSRIRRACLTIRPRLNSPGPVVRAGPADRHHRWNRNRRARHHARSHSAVCSKSIDGIPEKMRSEGLAQTPSSRFSAAESAACEDTR